MDFNFGYMAKKSGWVEAAATNGTMISNINRYGLKLKSFILTP